MIYDGELKAYFGREKVAPFVEVYSILMQGGLYIFDADIGALCPNPLRGGV